MVLHEIVNILKMRGRHQGKRGFKYVKKATPQQQYEDSAEAQYKAESYGYEEYKPAVKCIPKASQKYVQEEHVQEEYLQEEYVQEEYYPRQFSSNSKSRVTVLMVAEKPSIASTIANILGKNVKRRKGVSRVAMTFEYFGDFYGTPALFKVTSVAGHIFSRDFPREYNNWETVDPVKLFDARTVMEDKPKENFNITKHLLNEAKGLDYLVLWLDCDREGENICFEVLKVIGDMIPQSYERNIYRVHFSSLAEKDIQAAYNNLNDGPNLNESLSVDARQIIDLKVGAAFTRLQTLTLKKKYPELNFKIVSYGPCQTPTLGFCTDQYFKRVTFVPVDYWFLSAVIKRGEQTLKLTWDKNKVYSLVRILLSIG
jgi:DNA topoisomerase-3